MTRATTRLTVDNVRKFDGSEGPIRWCIDPRGFGVHYNKQTRHKAWLLKRGKQWKRIGRVDVMPLDEARALAKEILGEWAKGIDRFNVAKDTFGAILADYNSRRVDPARRTGKLYQRMADAHLADWKDRPLRSITFADVLKRYEQIMADVTANEAERAKAAGRQPDPTVCGIGSANLVSRVISLVWNHAQIFMELPGLGPNPTRKLELVRKKLKPREDYVEVEDLKRFHDAVMAQGRDKLDDPRRDAIRLILYTGLRIGNATRLRWSQVDLDKAVISIDAAEMKGQRDFKLPLNDLAASLLRERFANRVFAGSPYVFTRQDGRGPIVELAEALNAATAAAGLGHLRVQGIRRTYATACHAADLTYEQVGIMLDHAKPGGVTAHYVKGVDRRMSVWAATVGQFLADKIGSGPIGGNVKRFGRQKATAPVPVSAATGQSPVAMPA